ncbi:phospholipid phosphatase 2-like [Diorhabda sublineata]|uniref:phospholipid phosphatase 2-like n=1 Tax=Diorhabda sublineata TaxID=1163346 RepID=UPI0024E05823|nr:phospholipid phosphatase 2-like [Diorhabda sublineata]
MGAILSALGVPEPKLSLQPKKIVVGVLFGNQITSAYLLNVLIWIFVVLMIILLEFGVIPSVQQGFYCEDPVISHKYRQETISPVTLGVTAFLLPTIMVLLTEFLVTESIKNINIYSVVFYEIECLVGVTNTLFITSIAKVLVGEHRPHFLDSCQPNTAKNCTAGQFIPNFICTNENLAVIDIVDASLSFPSGHSSISWFIGIFTSYIIHSKMPVVNAGYITKQFFICICITWSLLCSLSRITDRRHHWWDVLIGSILGIGIAFYSIRIIREKLRDRNTQICSICLERRISLANKKQNFPNIHDSS